MAIDTTKPFGEMGAGEMDEIIRHVKKEIPKKRGRPIDTVQAVRLHGYIPGKMRDRFEACMEYAWRNRWINKETEYDFVNWAVERIMSSIEEEMSHSHRFPDLQDNLE